jgi:hypothetical protein
LTRWQQFADLLVLLAIQKQFQPPFVREPELDGYIRQFLVRAIAQRDRGAR